MKGFFLVVIIFTCISLKAQTSFPQDFIGKWKGTLAWFRAGDKKAQQVNMELYILPSKDTAGQFTWHLIYGSVSAGSRPYLLKPVDTAKGHWVIDEVNGIILDQYWVGNRFSGAFTVHNSTIVNTYYIENGQLIVEFYSYAAKPIDTTGRGTEESPYVERRAIKSFQRAVLKKQ